MPNIQLNYLYRCGGNYKNPGEVIFSNPNDKSLALVEAVIKSALQYEEPWFYANEWGLPNLYLSPTPLGEGLGGVEWDNDLDVTWHEYKGVEFTTDAATDNRTIDELLNTITAR